MIGSLRVGRRGATSKIGFDHVGEDGARFDDVESSDGRVHLVEDFSRRRRSSALIAHISLSISRNLRKLARNSRTSAWAAFGT